MKYQERLLDLDDQRTFDLLVDGELSPEQVRWLLASMEEQPSGWRRCALAFLEAQSWGRDLDVIRAEATASSPTERASNQATFSRRSLTILVMAAGLLVAFLLGLGMQSTRQGRQIAQPPKNTPKQNSQNQQENLKPQETQKLRENPALAKTTVPQTKLKSVDPYQKNHPPGTLVDLPLVHAAQASQEEWFNQRSVVPDHLLWLLRRSGHEVLQQRQWVPLDLQDGRRVIVPVDRVEVLYVGSPRIQ